ncbi:MAG: flagellin, partial [Ilumatobacteraceae bacterium]|nr:flagellin [Ilumatobacteraceae bacterium]
SLGKSLEKLSSGFRINRAADDAAGLVISQNLRAQTSGLRQATRNAQDGISVVQTAEGALNEVHTILNRMRDLAVQSANTGANDPAARTAAQAEITAMTAEIGRISTSTSFGGTLLLSGTYGGAVPANAKQFQIGANATDVLDVTITAVDATTLGINTSSVVTAADAATAITSFSAAIATVSTQRGNLGALQNRFESMINNLQVTTENLVASESRIRDTDMAAEMTNFTKNQILSQAGTAMLAQANQVPQSILSLLR